MQVRPVTWEGDQLRKGRQPLVRAMKIGFYNTPPFPLRHATDCAVYDTFTALRLPQVERSAGQGTLGSGPMEHVAKVCFVTVPQTLKIIYPPRIPVVSVLISVTTTLVWT